MEGENELFEFESDIKGSGGPRLSRGNFDDSSSDEDSESTGRRHRMPRETAFSTAHSSVIADKQLLGNRVSESLSCALAAPPALVFPISTHPRK